MDRRWVAMKNGKPVFIFGSKVTRRSAESFVVKEDGEYLERVTVEPMGLSLNGEELKIVESNASRKD